MTNAKPPCPTCNTTDKVKTKGGGSKGLYRYVCEEPSCGCMWQEVAPHKRPLNEGRRVVMKSLTKRDSGYKCGKCGAKKLGHTCPMASPSSPTDNLANVAIVAIGQTATAASSDLNDADDMPPLALFQQPVPFARMPARM